MTTTLKHFANVLIHSVQYSSQYIKNFNDQLQVSRKSDGSEVTQVDKLSQTYIFGIIHKYFPTINIIGEEDTIEQISTENIPEYEYKDFPIEDKELELSEITIYVDPLDGTSCFVKKEYEYVCVLVGALYKGKPFVGVISKPFHNCELFYAVENYHSEFPREQTPEKIIFTSSKMNDIKDKITEFPDPYELHYIGGSGSKMISIIQNKSDIYYHPVMQSCTWDTLACQVILELLGGKVCDVHGNDLQYPRKRTIDMVHRSGVVCMSARSVKYLPFIKEISKNILPFVKKEE